jgi:hypothetical protein
LYETAETLFLTAFLSGRQKFCWDLQKLADFEFLSEFFDWMGEWVMAAQIFCACPSLLRRVQSVGAP